MPCRFLKIKHVSPFLFSLYAFCVAIIGSLTPIWNNRLKIAWGKCYDVLRILCFDSSIRITRWRMHTHYTCENSAMIIYGECIFKNTLCSILQFTYSCFYLSPGGKMSLNSAVRMRLLLCVCVCARFTRFHPIHWECVNEYIDIEIYAHIWCSNRITLIERQNKFSSW